MTEQNISQKSRLIAFLLCTFYGIIGIHRFYTKRIGTGILMIITLGGCGIWLIVDWIRIIAGKFKDKSGNPITSWKADKKVLIPVIIIIAVTYSIGFISMITATGSSAGNYTHSGTYTSNNNSSTSENTTTTIQEEKVLKIGDTFTTKKLEIKVLALEKIKNLDDYGITVAPDGASFICIIYQLKNITKQPVNVSYFPVKLVDNEGTEYSEKLGYSISYNAKKNISGIGMDDISPNIAYKDSAIYEISNELWNSNEWYLEFSESFETYRVKVK